MTKGVNVLEKTYTEFEIIVDDLKHDFSFTIYCESLDDFLLIAERFPLSSYHFELR